MPLVHDSGLDQRIGAIAALDQPLRRDLHRLLATRGQWTSRDEAAAAIGVPRSVAAFHLDKLAEAGAVEVRFERTTGRSGPGAGRPSKLYRVGEEELTASVPERRYDLAGSLLATAIDESARSSAPVAECLHDVAAATGRDVGAGARAAISGPGDEAEPADLSDVVDLLSDHGYEPEVADDGEIVLANCPFHRLAEQHRDLVCGMNLDFLDGVLHGLEPDGRLTARLDPSPGHCCVRIAPT
jgi:predicted ArsR family transcriptional regulator